MTSSRGGSKGSQQVNNHLKAECHGDVIGFSGTRPGSKGDDESRTSRVDENVKDGGNQVAVQGNGAPQQLPQGSLVHWEKFLHLRSIKVMLVENDDCTRHIVTALLRNCNYEVIEAANGFQAWKILEDLSNHIDIVLTEVVMPCLSGIGLLCKIMSHRSRKNIPVIMMSSHDSMGLVFKCLSKGAVDFLVKPVRKNELKNLWQHVWRRCHSSSGSGSESGAAAQKSVNSKGNLRYDNSGSKDGDDDDGSDDGSGTQSSWTKQGIEPESPETASPCDQTAHNPDSTCGVVIRPLQIQATNDYNDQDNGGKVSKNSEMHIEFPMKDNDVKQINCMENGETEGEGEPEKIIIDDSSGEILVNEHGIKRARETIHENDKDVQNGCNILRHSELSAFTRYKTTLNGVKGTPGIIASCSQPDGRSNFVKIKSKRDAHSDGYLIYQASNEKVIPRKDDMVHQELQIQHIHHHHHVHHYHDDIDTAEQALLSNSNDDIGLNKMAADAPHCGSSNIMGGEVNLENYSLNGSASGSKHGSNAAVNFEVTNAESDGGLVGKDRIEQRKSAHREAALTKFRQKRQARCFQKKVRYQNRKKLAEQRPRIRGQFVKGTSRDNSNNAADG